MDGQSPSLLMPRHPRSKPNACGLWGRLGALTAYENRGLAFFVGEYQV